MEQVILQVVTGCILIMTFIGFASMGIDKNKAVRKAWRVPERTLFLVAFLGGGIGSLLGMYLFRHKTKHTSFIILIPIAAVLNLSLILKLWGII